MPHMRLSWVGELARQSRITEDCETGPHLVQTAIMLLAKNESDSPKGRLQRARVQSTTGTLAKPLISPPVKATILLMEPESLTHHLDPRHLNSPLGITDIHAPTQPTRG